MPLYPLRQGGRKMQQDEPYGRTMEAGKADPAQPESNKDIASKGQGDENGQEKAGQPEKVPAEDRAYPESKKELETEIRAHVQADTDGATR